MNRQRYSAKKFGQVYLVNREVAEYEVSLLDLKENETVLEIGPGNGELTEFLLGTKARIIAIELDSLSVEFLENKFSDFIASGRLTVREGSFLDLEPLECSAIIGNVPYNITSDILFRINEFDFDRAVLMVQKEVADRAVATKGTDGYSRLSVNCYLRYRIEKKREVPSIDFNPEPLVDSSILFIRKRNQIDPETLDEVDAVLKRAFSLRRKKMKNIFRNCPEEFRGRRPEELSPEDFVKITASTGSALG